MSLMDERELFTRTYAGTSADELWAAVKRALATMDLRATDEAQRMARFGSGVSLTSWGQHLMATVGDSNGGSVLTVRGRPKGSLLTTTWGEDIHMRKVEQQIVRSVEAALREHATPR